jgi:exonuclease SbcD
MRFIHCADIHLDSPLRGLELYDGAPSTEMRARHPSRLRQCRRPRHRARRRFRPDRRRHLRRRLAGLQYRPLLRRAVAPPGRADIRVFLTYGNHDAVSKLTRSVPLPQNVFRFPGQSSGDEVLDERLGVAIHGQSFRQRGGDRSTSRRLSRATQRAAQHRPPAHRAVGPRRTSALRADHGRATADKGYDYWALGHVHTREIVANRRGSSSPAIRRGGTRARPVPRAAWSSKPSRRSASAPSSSWPPTSRAGSTS